MEIRSHDTGVETCVVFQGPEGQIKPIGSQSEAIDKFHQIRVLNPAPAGLLSLLGHINMSSGS